MSAEWYDKLQANPESYANIAMQLQSKLRMMQQRIDQLTTVSPKERLHRLQEWFTLYLGDIPIYEILTQSEIGQLIGVRRETVNRLLREQAKTRQNNTSFLFVQVPTIVSLPLDRKIHNECALVSHLNQLI